MRLIDADALYISVMKKVCDDCPYDDDMECDGDDCKAGMMLRMIDDAPTVDAVEVVHCKDCRYWWGESEQCMDEMGFARKWEADDYCSNGERREE